MILARNASIDKTIMPWRSVATDRAQNLRNPHTEQPQLDPHHIHTQNNALYVCSKNSRLLRRCSRIWCSVGIVLDLMAMIQRTWWILIAMVNGIGQEKSRTKGPPTIVMPSNVLLSPFEWQGPDTFRMGFRTENNGIRLKSLLIKQPIIVYRNWPNLMYAKHAF